MAAELVWRFGAARRCVFSRAGDGDMHLPVQRSRWLRSLGLADCARQRQVHGTRVRQVQTTGFHGDGDGLVSQHAVPLLAYGADCPAVALVAPEAYGVAHCGWRGTAAGMVSALVAALQEFCRSRPPQWQALIGPGIAGPVYEVDAPVLQARTWPDAALRPGRDAQHAQLDLATVLREDLAAAGVGSIRCSGICTAGDVRLHSYRHDGPGLVQALLLYHAAD